MDWEIHTEPGLTWLLCLLWVEFLQPKTQRSSACRRKQTALCQTRLSAQSAQSTADPARLPPWPVYKDVTDVCVCLSLTFAGVRVRVRPLGVPVEAGFAPLALTALCVVRAVTHATAALARLAPRRPIKVAALGVAVTLALWGRRKRWRATCQHLWLSHDTANFYFSILFDLKRPVWFIFYLLPTR